MYCFRHPAVPAVGICKACGKGLCTGCAADEPFGLACRDSCEERVQTLGRIVDMSTRSAVWSNSVQRTYAAFAVVLGIVFLGFAAACHLADQDFLTLFFGLMGLVQLVFGLIRLLARRLPEVTTGGGEE